MRKIYQSAPDVPQAISNKAIDIIERHLTASGVRRAEDLPEESKIHLYRELKSFFESDLPPLVFGKDGEIVYGRSIRERNGLIGAVLRWFRELFGGSEGH